MEEHPVIKLSRPVEFGRSVNRAYPQAQEIGVEARSPWVADLLVIGADGELYLGRACLGLSGLWTISPLQ